MRDCFLDFFPHPYWHGPWQDDPAGHPLPGAGQHLQLCICQHSKGQGPYSNRGLDVGLHPLPIWCFYRVCMNREGVLNLFAYRPKTCDWVWGNKRRKWISYRWPVTHLKWPDPFESLKKKCRTRRDNAGAVCNSGMGILFLCSYFFYIISLRGDVEFFLCMMHDAWCMMHDSWCMIHDAWCMMHDAWCMMHDAWCMMHEA